MKRVLKLKGGCVLNDLALPGLLAARIFTGLLENHGGIHAVADIAHHLKSKGFEIVYAGEPKGAIVKRFSIIAQKS